MIRSILIGLATGSRSLTPLAVVSDLERQGAMPPDSRGIGWLGHPLVNLGIRLLAVGELWGDKWKSAPDRIVRAGIAARLVTGGLAGAAMAPRNRALAGAALGATAAVGAAYLTFNLRMRALRRFGQTPSGLVEDALDMAAARLVARL